MVTAYVAVGSNLGDRRQHLDHALVRVGSLGRLTGGSPIYETAPVGGPDDQDAYLNAVLEIDTSLPPRELLDGLLDIEAERGRTREVRWGPRTLDLDLLWYAGRTVEEPGLSVPHREIRNRPFVLAPLTDLAPSIGDAAGPFSDSYPPSGEPGIARVTGPVHPDGSRWMVGLADAIELAPNGEARSCIAHPDWANTSSDAFGAFLVGVALEAVRGLAPGMSPSHFTYRFLHAVPEGAQLDVTVGVDRSSARSMDTTVTLRVAGEIFGRCSVSALTHPPEEVSGPPRPGVMGFAGATPAYRLVEQSGRTVGMSIRSWSPLERWDVPDLADGSQRVVRAWSPNVVFGGTDPYLHAASIAMPIDALIWPATLQRLGQLPDDTGLSTPTVELTARFGQISTDAWHLGEASVDHFTEKSVSGTVRVWGGGGRYAAIGHSLNLIRR
jgi:2-amino-4-hydroxy-6-hydroxymethyldihydropteridine diphosphokinase